MKRTIIVLLVAAVLLGVGPATAADGTGQQCSCSSDHWLSGGCSLTGPCPCTCSCGIFRCGCRCAGLQLDNPVAG